MLNFCVSEDGAPFTVSGDETSAYLRERRITVEPYPHRRTSIGQGQSAEISQNSDYQGVFAKAASLRLLFEGVSRDDWNVLKHEVDRAFDEFERRWPAEPKAEAT